jgi:hypothetical protein
VNRGSGFFISGNRRRRRRSLFKPATRNIKGLVEPIGIEPMTSSLQS